LKKVEDLTKEVFLSLLFVLYCERENFKKDSYFSKATFEKLLEVNNKLELSENEKLETQDWLDEINMKIN
jgi:hypothetical protein